MKTEPAKDLQERIKEESKAYSGSVMEDEYNPLRKYTSDDLIEEIEYAFEQGANFILKEWEEAERYNMKKKEEILKEATKRTLNINEGSPLHDAVMKAMGEYAQQQVKNRFIPQPIEIEKLMKEKWDYRMINDDLGWTGEWRMSAKDVLDLIIDLQNGA